MSKIKNLIKIEEAKLLKYQQLLKETKLRKIIREEYESMIEEVEEKSEDISTKLETMRKDLIEDAGIHRFEKGSAHMGLKARPERRIPIETVSKVLDIPINELLLYFLNGHRIQEGYDCLYEYRLGCVYFYGAAPDEPK